MTNRHDNLLRFAHIIIDCYDNLHKPQSANILTKIKKKLLDIQNRITICYHELVQCPRS